MIVSNSPMGTQTLVVVDAKRLAKDETYRILVRKFIHELGRFQGIPETGIVKFECEWNVFGYSTWHANGILFRIVLDIVSRFDTWEEGMEFA